MFTINRRAAVHTAKILAIVAAVFIAVILAVSYVPFNYIMVGFGLISFLYLVKIIYDYYIWKFDREKIDKKSKF